MIIIPNTPTSSGFSNTVINLVAPAYQTNLESMAMSPDGSIICALQENYGTVNFFSAGATDSYLTYKVSPNSNAAYRLAVTSNKVLVSIYSGMCGFSTTAPYSSIGSYISGTPVYGGLAVNAAETEVWAGQQSGQPWVARFSATDLGSQNIAQFTTPAGCNDMVSAPDTSNPGQTILYGSHYSGISKMKTVDGSVTSLSYTAGGKIALNAAKTTLYAVNGNFTVRVIDTATFTQTASTTATAIGVSGIKAAVPNLAGDKLYVTHSAGIAVLDSTSLSVVASITQNHLGANLTSVNDIRFNPLGTKAYAATNGGLLVIV